MFILEGEGSEGTDFLLEPGPFEHAQAGRLDYLLMVMDGDRERSEARQGQADLSLASSCYWRPAKEERTQHRELVGVGGERAREGVWVCLGKSSPIRGTS